MEFTEIVELKERVKSIIGIVLIVWVLLMWFIGEDKWSLYKLSTALLIIAFIYFVLFVLG